MATELGDGNPGPEVREPGKVENPVTLYPTEGEPKKPADKKKKAAAKASSKVNKENLKAGDTLDSDNAPQIASQPITITCEVEPKGHDGVIVAHGGTAVGYTLYLKEGRAIFAVHAAGNNIARVASPSAIGAKAILQANLGKGGTITHSVDGKEVATGKAGGLINRQPQESFCVGHDDGKPVDDYDGTAVFQGGIANLKVTAGPQK